MILSCVWCFLYLNESRIFVWGQYIHMSKRFCEFDDDGSVAGFVKPSLSCWQNCLKSLTGSSNGIYIYNREVDSDSFWAQTCWLSLMANLGFYVSSSLHSVIFFSLFETLCHVRVTRYGRICSEISQHTVISTLCLLHSGHLQAERTFALLAGRAPWHANMCHFKSVFDFVAHVHEPGCVELLKLETFRFIPFTDAYYRFHVTWPLTLWSWILECLPVLSWRTPTLILTLLTTRI